MRSGGLGWDIDAEDLTRRAEEALYTAVGLGILGFQHLQVRRRELARSLEDIVHQVTDPRPGPDRKFTSSTLVSIARASRVAAMRISPPVTRPTPTSSAPSAARA